MHAGTVNRRLVGRDVNGSAQVEVVLGVLEPGGVAKRHSHGAQEQAVYILEGRALVEVGDRVKEEVGPGTACFFPVGMPHRVEALTPVRALVIYAPPLERSTSDQPFRPA
jgi:quercetin dioxygenase-like cupin family protein